MFLFFKLYKVKIIVLDANFVKGYVTMWQRLRIILPHEFQHMPGVFTQTKAGLRMPRFVG